MRGAPIVEDEGIGGVAGFFPAWERGMVPKSRAGRDYRQRLGWAVL